MYDLELVITMAGLGSRFREVGYEMPKYMISVQGKTLFEWAMMSLKGYEDRAFQYIFIVMEDQKQDVDAFIRSSCEKMGITNYKIILIDYLTKGQASTAMLAAKYWNRDHGLLIYNIDTYVEQPGLKSEDLCGDGFLPCFRAQGDHWSFVRLDAGGKVVEIKEKERISDYCTIGAYYFKTCGLFEALYKDYYQDSKHLVKGEKYIAPLYNYLLAKGGEVYITEIDSHWVHVLGTPKEVKEFAMQQI